MTLIVADDVDATRLAARLNAGLGAWRPTAVKPLRIVASPAIAAQRLQLVDRPRAQQSDVRLGLVTIERKDKRYAAYEVLANALCGGFTSRVTQRLREQLGIIYHAYSATDWRLGPGPYVMWTAIDTPETARGLSEMLKLVDDFATTPMPAAELDKAKQNLIRALPDAFATNAQIASTFGQLALLGLPDAYYTSYAAAIRRVTAADIQAVAKDVMPPARS
jgi:zinc protease